MSSRMYPVTGGLTLSTAKVPEDTPGDAYEYLIGNFADDGGHTAQEFYTNRTVVHLMTQMLKPQPGERIYDPTCGTGGMLPINDAMPDGHSLAAVWADWEADGDGF